MRPIGSHSIRRCHGTQGNCSFVSTLISHYTDRLYRQQDNTCLPYLIIQSPITQSLNKDIIRILQDTYLLRRNISQNTYCQPRSRERMTGNQMFRHPSHTNGGRPGR